MSTAPAFRRNRYLPAIKCSCGHEYTYIVQYPASAKTANGFDARGRLIEVKRDVLTIAELSAKPCPHCTNYIRCLTAEPKSIEQLIAYAGGTVASVIEAMTMAELRGEARTHHVGHYVKA